MLITNVHILPMVGDEIADGWVQTEGARIRALGAMPAPAGQEETVDGGGALLLPGFIDAHSHLGMWEDSLGFEGDDGNEETDPVTPQLRAIDAINPNDACFAEALAAGVTTVVTGPGSANPIGGQMAAVSTCGTCIDDMVLRAPVSMKMALGENPKSIYHGRNQAPMTRMATAALIREALLTARRYDEDLKKSQNDPDADPPEYDAKCEALLPVIRGELPVHFHAHRLDDIFTAVRIAKEFGLRLVIVHGTGAAAAAERLAAEGVPILSGPLLSDRSKPELHELTPATPGILAAAGVPVGIVCDHPVIPQQYLGLCAGLAVREGMSRQSALEALTIVPARILGLADEIGSVEPGKRADLVLFDADPLTVAAKPVMVIAGGKVVCAR
ncbi:MAG: amidohydrolase [Clostridia bacterium]|nr:amidohydrolase [Clostridia bacterium]